MALYDDGVETATTASQRDVEITLEFALNQDKELDRLAHAKYLTESLSGLPASMKALDASRPWIIYWSLHSLLTLGISLDHSSRSRAISTLSKYQNASGGFGGGRGQISHVLTTYASVMSLVIAGGPGDGNGWDAIDRRGVYDFLMRVKQQDGSFIVHEGGEVDVRGCYCALAVATILDILTPELLHNVEKFVASCQTFEGGFSACSQDGLQLGEAHGGYTSCALSALTMVDSTRSSKLNTTFDLDGLIRWSVHMQGLKTELGGFRGRTNKLVDGCYSWWLGGSFSLFEYWQLAVDSKDEDNEDDDWVDEEGCLYDREALQGYVLNAAQNPKGGLRDKPGKNSDTYHTAYNISGLSASQHYIKYDADRARQMAVDFNENADNMIPTDNPQERSSIRRFAYASAMGWMPDKAAKKELKSLEPYLARAKELVNVEPAISYWCKFYVLQNALQQKPGKEGEILLLELMTELEENEELKDLVTDEDAANAYIENFALRVFIKADDMDRAGTVNKIVAKTFLASTYFLSLLTLFKNPPGDLQQKLKYARFKTTQIMNATKMPQRGSPRASTSTSPKLETTGLPQSTGSVPPRLPSPKSSSRRGSVSIPAAGSLPSPKQSPHTSLHGSPRSRSVTSLPQTQSTQTNRQSVVGTKEFAQLSLQGDEPTDEQSNEVEAEVPQMNPGIVSKAQKHARWAISALNYEDKDTAMNQLQLALDSLKG
ncbi:hypothetical protein E3P92_03720 [Wallemia ichthyophaga]|nr:hypothetical protein E3P92_03720 [Wallemia ichthyophaga]